MSSPCKTTLPPRLQDNTASQERELAAYAFKERRFSGAVGSDHGQDLAAEDLQIYILQNYSVRVSHREPAQRQEVFH